LENIEQQTMKLLGYGHARDVHSSSVQFREGDVLYGKMRPYLNKVWVAEFDGICSAEFLVFPKSDWLNSQFLALRLNAEDFVTFANGKVSGQRPRVDFEALSPFPIHLPPIAEQERIVAKLIVVLTSVQRAEMAAHRALERLKGYRAAVLNAGITGELTRSWRKTHKPDETGAQLLQRLLELRRDRWEQAELQHISNAVKHPTDDNWKARYPDPIPPRTQDMPNFPSTWALASVEQLLQGNHGMAYGILKPGNPVSNGVPMLRIVDISEDGTIATKGIFHVSRALAQEFKRTRLETYDVLLSIMGTIGRTAIVPDRMDGANVNRALAVLKLIDKKLAPFVFLVFRSSWLQTLIARTKMGSAQQRINLSDLRWFPVPIPSLVEQAEIVREAEHRISAAARLTNTLKRQLDHARVTRQSLLRDAFTGRLVPQKPSDEPASVLLECIRASRKAEAKKPKGKRMSKSKPTRRPLLDVLREHTKPITPEQLFDEAGFQPAQADTFYRELASLRKIIQEKKPDASEAKAWPYRAHVLLELKKR
jgi:type I restriction enzyme, S subunit